MDNIETLESKYPWVKFYRELAQKLLEYKDDRNKRKEFLMFIQNVIEENNLKKERPFFDNNTIKQDIDPYSIIAYTLYSTLEEHERENILLEYKKHFEIVEPVPESIVGLNKSQYLTFWTEDNIDILWDFFESVYTGSTVKNISPDGYLSRFNKKFTTLFTILFAIKPQQFIRCNTSVVDFCRDNLGLSFDNINNNYERYLEFKQKVEDRIAEGTTEYNSFIDVCKAADEYEVNKTTTNNNPTTMNKDVDNIIKILESNKNIILQGAPGCGKTYITTDVAVKLCDVELPTDKAAIKKRYKELVEEGRIGFTTFHQSMDYEEFVEGLKPEETDDGQMKFVVKPGIFKRICTEATKDDNKKKNFVLIIDEINRANVSKVLGELITLLESSKRLEEDDEFKVTLPYSGETFGVPSNLYIIGTMNTADRSVGYIDYAIRRRFAFYTLKANEDAIIKFYEDNKEKVEDLNEKETKLFEAVEKIVDKNLAQDFNQDDLMVGHSYFMAKSKEEFDFNLEYKIKPLLKEYVRDGILIVDSVKDSIDKLPANSDTSKEK